MRFEKLGVTKNLKAIRPVQKCSGVSLLEVLITVVVLAAGLLGVASMQILGVQHNQGANARTQASLLAYDIMDRMRNNYDASASYSKVFTDVPSQPAGTENCALTACTPAQIAAYDLYYWDKSVDELLPNSENAISYTDTTSGARIFTIQIRWQDSRRGDEDQDGDTDEQYKTFQYKGEL